MPPIVRVEVRVVLPSGEGDVGEPPIDKVFSSPIRIDVDKDTIGGLPLTAVTRDRVPEVEMLLIARRERERAPRVQSYTHVATRVDRLNGAEFTVRDVPLTIRRRELDAIAWSKCAVRLSIQRHAL